jgi:hypothetical protein
VAGIISKDPLFHIRIETALLGEPCLGVYLTAHPFHVGRIVLDTGPPPDDANLFRALVWQSEIPELGKQHISISGAPEGPRYARVHVYNFDGLTPEQVSEILAVWHDAWKAPRGRRPKSRPKYIQDLRRAYFKLRPVYAKTGKRPSHAECAQIVGTDTEGRAIKLGASIQRLKRAKPPASWEQLTKEWEAELIGQWKVQWER